MKYGSPTLPREALFDIVRTSWSMAARSFAMFPLAQRIDRVPLPAFEHMRARVAHVTADYQLRHLPGDGEPILIVSSLINRPYVLDLDPEHSYLRMLSGLGRPIYVIEWLAAKPADDRSFGDFCAGPVRSAIEHVCAAHGADALSLMGYSMGGTLAACSAARFPERVARLALLCTPLRFDNAGAFTRWLSPSFVNANFVGAIWDRVPAQLVNLPFWCLDPAVKLRKLGDLAQHHGRPGYLEHFFAAETWNHDNVDLPRGLVRTWLGELYQRNALATGRLEVGGRTIDLSEIHCPTLLVTGESDTITPPACAEVVPGARVLRLDAGHVGVLTSRRALAAQAPVLANWLGERA